MDFVNVPNLLSPSILSSRTIVRREFFNPENQTHVDSLKEFVRTGNWGKVQFHCEHPYTDVPMTVFMSFLEYELGVKREPYEAPQSEAPSDTAD